MGSYNQKKVLIAGGTPEMRELYIKRLKEENAVIIVLGNKLLHTQNINNNRESAHVSFAYCDFSSKRSVDQAIHEVINQEGRIDVLINHLEIQRFGGILDIGEDEWKREIVERLRVMFFVNQSVIRTMIDRNCQGVVVDTVYTEDVAEDFISYPVVAGSVEQIVGQMAEELKAYGIRVNGLGAFGIAKETKLLETVSRILFLGNENADVASGVFSFDVSVRKMAANDRHFP